MPYALQMASILPLALREQFPSTYGGLGLITDASGIFLQALKELNMQPSTLSNYKHHNTAKSLIGCTSNGCIPL